MGIGKLVRGNHSGGAKKRGPADISVQWNPRYMCRRGYILRLIF